MRCADCRHWTVAERDWEAERAGFRLCKAVREQWKITGNEGIPYPHRPPEEPWNAPTPPEREAAIEAYLERDAEAIRHERAYVVDGSEYRAELWTGPDFGCVKFEPAQGIETRRAETEGLGAEHESSVP